MIILLRGEKHIAPLVVQFEGKCLMLEDIIILVALAILVLALIWLLSRMIGALRVQRSWVKGWVGWRSSMV